MGRFPSRPPSCLALRARVLTLSRVLPGTAGASARSFRMFFPTYDPVHAILVQKIANGTTESSKTLGFIVFLL